MRSDDRSFGLGMVIGVALAAAALLLTFLFNSMSPSARQLDFAPIASPSELASTATTVPTIAPTLTAIPAATGTPMPDSAIEVEATALPDPLADLITSGGLAFSGPLALDRQIAVYEAAAAYVQGSVEDSKLAAKEINEVGYGDPSNICGPLALAILRDASLVPADLSPHDYWLLDPRNVPDKRLLENALPNTIYSHEIITTPLNKVDWSETPLQPGDFVFIWHGSGGNFDHMLVVSRVDSAGRAYSVTNFGTPEGYVIAETMLYDPQDSAAGIFHTWTRVRDAILGSTGFGGYELWRMRSP